MTQTETFAELMSEAGLALLAEATLLPPDPLVRLTRLRKRYPAELAAAAVELLELRKRAAAKFARADELWFTREGWEQSTGERIAAYRAAQFPPDVLTLDACCGIGGDALALAEHCPVLAADLNPTHALCTHANARLSNESFPVATLCADVTTLDLERLKGQGIGAVFFDPSRRTTSASGERKRVRNGDDYAPPLSFAHELSRYFPFVAVKVSPALDDAALQEFQSPIEFISERGECKEAVIWIGEIGGRISGVGERHFPTPNTQHPASYSATILLPNDQSATLTNFSCEVQPSSDIRRYLYEPDPAVIRANLISQLTQESKLFPVNLQRILLTTDDEISTPFTARYRVRETVAFRPEKLRRHLKVQGWRVGVIKKRGLDLEPETLRRQLNAGLTEGDSVTLFLFRQGERVTGVICDSL